MHDNKHVFYFIGSLHRAVSRNPNPTTVSTTRRLFGWVAATVVGLGFWVLHFTFIMVRVKVRGFNSPHSTCASYIEAVTTHIAPTHHT